ncbi:MAG: hypothetical protein CBD29_07625 [Synechococcus sp. TMED169]|jgi:hypothetical protein|nr:MAG: hypothetical protein CBD29_07625 [Synechococcus sp. TMED169]
MAEQVFLFRKAVEFGEQTLRELRGRGLEDEEIGLVRLYLKYKGISFRYELWELGFAYYMKYTRDAYNGSGELRFILEDETDVPDWQRRVREIDEALKLMDEELESSGGSEFFAWMAITLNKLKNVARS